MERTFLIAQFICFAKNPTQWGRNVALTFTTTSLNYVPGRFLQRVGVTTTSSNLCYNSLTLVFTAAAFVLRVMFVSLNATTIINTLPREEYTGRQFAEVFKRLNTSSCILVHDKHAQYNILVQRRRVQRSMRTLAERSNDCEQEGRYTEGIGPMGWPQCLWKDCHGLS